MRRTFALWLLLFGVYAATLGLDAFGASDYAGDEPHYLLAAESLVDDRNVDVRDEYAARAYDDFYPSTSTRTAGEDAAQRAAWARIPLLIPRTCRRSDGCRALSGAIARCRSASPTGSRCRRPRSVGARAARSPG